MSYQLDPKNFMFGTAFREGIQQSQDNKRKNALLDLEKQQFGLQQGQFDLNKKKHELEQAAAQSSIGARAKFLEKYAGFDPETASSLAADADVPDLIVELTKMKGGGGNSADVDEAIWFLHASEPERQAYDYTQTIRMQNKLGEVAGVPSLIDARYRVERPPLMSGGAPQAAPQQYPLAPPGFSGGGGRVETMQPYESVAQPAPQAPGGGGTRPLSSIEAEAAAAETIKEAEGRGSVTGQETAKRQQAINTKLQNIQNMDELLDMAGPLVQLSTGSVIGAGVDKAASFFGFAPSGAEAIAALQPISAALLANVPRMEGPQSDADRVQYERAAGDLANPTTPKEARLAAIRTIKRVNSKYRELNHGQTKSRTVVRTGKLNGKNVVEYSDGAVEYAP